MNALDVNPWHEFFAWFKVRGQRKATHYAKKIAAHPAVSVVAAQVRVKRITVRQC